MIEEFPFSGIITRTIIVQQENGDIDESVVEIYNGQMDVSLNTAEVGSIAQTSNYIVSMPLIKRENNTYVLPKKDDKITVNMYGDIFTLTVNNYIPSQVGGLTIYSSRGDW